MIALSSFLVDHLWQSTLFAAAAWLLTLALKANAARVRYAVWLAASAKFFVPFAALVAIGSQFSWRTAAQPLEANVTVFINRVGAVAPHELRLFTGTVAPPAPAVPAASTLLSSAAAAVSGALPWLYAAWLCGGLAVLLVWTIRWRRVAAVAREGSPMSSGRELALLRRLETARGILRPTALVATDAAVEPGVFGIVRPVLLWPQTIADHLSDCQIEAILAHEVSHVRRRDNLAAAMHMVVQAVFWFHPVVWWLGARLVDERERACDEDVIRAGAEPQVYAEGILRTCEFYVESPMACVTGVTGSDLKKRIEQIMRGHEMVRLGAPKRLLLSAAAVAAIAAPVIVGAATASPRRAPFERRFIESRRYVLGGPRQLLERQAEPPPIVLKHTEAQAAAPSGSPRPQAPPSLSGIVRGPKGGPVSNATIALTHVETNADATARSDGLGHFDFSRLPPGEYLLGVTANGLEPFHGRVTVPAGKGITLEVGLQAETIAIGMTVGKGFPGPRQGPAAPMPPTWSCIDRPMGRDCGPPSLLQELEHDRQEQEAARTSLATRPAWPVKSAPPHYPQELWDAMIEGSVVIEGRIGEDGVPTALEVVAPVHPDFAKEALDTVSQWRFEPARQDGGPLSVPLKVTINFRLSSARARLPGAD
jgi:TonB family protein